MTLKRPVALLLVCFLSLSMFAASGAADDHGIWSGFGGGASHDHLSESSTEGNLGGLVWHQLVSYVVGGQPVITDHGTIILNDGSGNVTEVSLNGTPIRKVNMGEECLQTPALGPNGTVVISSNDTLHLLDRNLTEIWSRNFSKRLTSPTIADDGTIYVSTEASDLVSSSGLYAIDSDGQIKWSIRNEYVDAGKVPAIGPDGTVYDGGMELAIRAVSPEGNVLWQFREYDPQERSGADRASICVGPDGTAYVGTFDHILYAFDPNGTVKWTYEAQDAIVSTPSLGPDGTVYFSTCNTDYDDYAPQKLYAIDSEGRYKWSFNVNGAYASPPAVSSDGRIYFYDPGRGLVALDPDGELLWIAGGWPDFYVWDASSPVIGDDGTVYAVMGGELMAFNIGAPGQPRDVRMFREGSSARVTWDIPYTDGGSDIIGYAVYRNAWRSEPFYVEDRMLVAVLDGPDARFFQDQELTEDVSYSYTVRAINGYGEGLMAEAEPLDDEKNPEMPFAVVLVFVASAIAVWCLDLGKKRHE